MFRFCAAAALFTVLLNASEQHGTVKFGGLGVPGATVTATQRDKTQSVITDQQGVYTFTDLPDGAWTFQVEMLCFSPIKQEVSITTGLPAPDWDLTLLPMSEIQAAAGPAVSPPPPPKPAIQLTQSAPKKKNAPTPPPQTGFQRTDVNASNAVPPPPGDTSASQNAADLSQRASDGFLINGSSNNGASSPFAQSNAFGNNRRGARSLYTGNLSLVLDNSALDARPFSLTGLDTPKVAYNHIQGGFALSGPLRIPHLLRNGPTFFLNYQWMRNRTANTLPYLVPTQAERNGDFSQTLNAQGQPVQIIDPLSGMPFEGNIIPQNRLSPVALKLLNFNFYPLPNFAGSTRYNYQTSITGLTNQNSLQSRMSKAIGTRDQVFGNFAFQGTDLQSTNLFGFVDRTSTLGITTTVNWSHRFNNRIILHFADTFSRLGTTTTPYFANGTDVSGNAGILGNNRAPVNFGPPNLSFSSGIAALTDANAAANHNQTNALSFDGLWYRSPHSFTWGADFKRMEFNAFSQQNPRGSFQFTGQAAGDDFAEFLLGIPDAISIAYGNADKYFRSNSWDAFINDDWRINPGLTINWGVRWEYNSPISELYGRLVNLAVTPGFTSATPVIAGNSSTSLVHPDLHAFQPRLGFSWRPFPASSMVVRGGYGVYYNTSVYQNIALQMAQQPQLPNTKSFSIANTSLLTLANGFDATPPATPNTFAIDPDFRIGYAQNWQLSVQRDLPKGLMMTATYLGIKGTREVQEFVPNTYPTGAVTPTGFLYMTSNGNSTRESGQFQLRRRLRSGFTASIDYTYSKSIDDAALGGRGQGTAVVAQNWLDLRAERGLSPFDQRHLVAVNAQYTTGMGLGGGTLLDGWRGRLYKEWTLVTQINAGTGLPLTPTVQSVVPGTGITGPIRPDYTGAPLYDAPNGLFLNPSAYIVASGHWGNAGRDTITGPDQFTLNASLARTFRITDRFSLDARVDSTNALNHVTFSTWNTVVNSPQFGTANSPNAMRTISTTLRLRF